MWEMRMLEYWEWRVDIPLNRQYKTSSSGS